MSLHLIPQAQADPHNLNRDPTYRDSVLRAMVACLRERAEVYEKTGVRIRWDGSIVLPAHEADFAGLGLALGNAFAAAIYGTRGEL